jgi:hypothetical protein
MADFVRVSLLKMALLPNSSPFPHKAKTLVLFMISMAVDARDISQRRDSSSLERRRQIGG